MTGLRRFLTISGSSRVTKLRAALWALVRVKTTDWLTLGNFYLLFSTESSHLHSRLRDRSSWACMPGSPRYGSLQRT